MMFFFKLGLFLSGVTFISYLLTIDLTKSSTYYDLYLNLSSKIGVLSQDNMDLQYTNVSYCDKVVSITVNHIALEILKVKPDAMLLAVDKKKDIAVFSRLSLIEASPLANLAPIPFDDVYIATYAWMLKVMVIYKYTVISDAYSNLLVQGIAFFGASGSGVYNELGEFVGSVSVLALGPNRDGQSMQIGIIGVTRLDVIKALMEEKVCKAP